MIINIPEIKGKLTIFVLISIPIIIGAIDNIILFSIGTNNRILSHIALYMLSIVFIIGGIGSIFIYKKPKSLFNYGYCILSLAITQTIIFFSFTGNESKVIYLIYFVIFPYGLYLMVKSLFFFKKHLKKRFKLFLRNKNIHIITTMDKNNLIKKYPNYDFNNPHNFDKRYNNFNTEIKRINECLNSHSTQMINELKLFEHDAISVKKSIAEESIKYVELQRKFEKLNKIKDISEEQIDIILEKHNKMQILYVILGFLLGIIGSLIASYIVTIINS